jgi:hypothetical protein
VLPCPLGRCLVSIPYWLGAAWLRRLDWSWLVPATVSRSWLRERISDAFSR